MLDGDIMGRLAFVPGDEWDLTPRELHTKRLLVIELLERMAPDLLQINPGAAEEAALRVIRLRTLTGT